MHKFKKIILFSLFIISIFSCNAFSKTTTHLASTINNIIKKNHQNAHIGIYVVSLKTNKVEFQKNANALFTPASVQKLITTTAALTFLKPNFKFQTSEYISGKIHNKQLNGDVLIKFNGDPSFTYDDLNQLIKHIHAKGIHTINGDIIIDTSAYNKIPYPPGYLWDDLSYDFAAPLRSVIIDDNKFGVNFTPAKNTHEKPTLSTALPLNTIHIENNLKTVDKFQKHCPITIYSDAHNHYEFNGCLLKQNGEQYRTLAIRNPRLVLASLIKKQLHDNKITFVGKIKTGSIPNNAHKIETHFSKPLSELVKHLLKTSDNLYTSTLVKKLGQEYFHKQGTWQNGLRAIKEILKKNVGINVKSIQINDGAGLSRYNLLSPKSVGQILVYINNHSYLQKVFWKALPIAGVDGTLASRLKMFAKGKKLRAKTGTMTGISSLAGYAFNRNNKYVFVTMINGYVGKKTPFA